MNAIRSNPTYRNIIGKTRQENTVFKQPRNRSEAISRAQQRDELIAAARVLDHCKVEPDIAAKLRRLAAQMDTALAAYQRVNA